MIAIAVFTRREYKMFASLENVSATVDKQLKY